MGFILAGFTQDTGFRVFTFARIGADAMRTEYTVRADLALIRRYDIRMQELPLLCRNLLDRCEDAGETHTLTFTEEEMRRHANDRATARQAAAQKRKPPRMPRSQNLGAAWRGHNNREIPPAHTPSIKSDSVDPGGLPNRCDESPK